jgi:hypothetical protein
VTGFALRIDVFYLLPVFGWGVPLDGGGMFVPCWPLFACCPLWEDCPPFCDMSRGDGFCFSMVLLLNIGERSSSAYAGADIRIWIVWTQAGLPLAAER